MHAASKNGHLEVVQCLLEGKANVNAKSGDGEWTPLHVTTKPSDDTAPLLAPVADASCSSSLERPLSLWQSSTLLVEKYGPINKARAASISRMSMVEGGRNGVFNVVTVGLAIKRTLSVLSIQPTSVCTYACWAFGWRCASRWDKLMVGDSFSPMSLIPFGVRTPNKRNPAVT